MNIFFTTCFLVIIPSLFGCLLSKKRVECFFAPTLLSSALVLYLFGWAWHLKAGLYTVQLFNSLMFLAIPGIIAFHILKKDSFFSATHAKK